MARPGLDPMPCEAAERPLIAVAAVGARGWHDAVPYVALDGRTRGGVHVCGRVCMCIGVYFCVPNVARAHVVTVLIAVARVADKRARIGMMTIFFGRVNGTVTSEWGVLH